MTVKFRWGRWIKTSISTWGFDGPLIILSELFMINFLDPENVHQKLFDRIHGDILFWFIHRWEATFPFPGCISWLDKLVIPLSLRTDKWSCGYRFESKHDFVNE